MFDASNLVGTILTDLPKACSCLPHGLLAAKLAAYGLDSLCIMYSYMDNRYRRTKLVRTKVSQTK